MPQACPVPQDLQALRARSDSQATPVPPAPPVFQDPPALRANKARPVRKENQAPQARRAHKDSAARRANKASRDHRATPDSLARRDLWGHVALQAHRATRVLQVPQVPIAPCQAPLGPKVIRASPAVKALLARVVSQAHRESWASLVHGDWTETDSVAVVGLLARKDSLAVKV